MFKNFSKLTFMAPAAICMLLSGSAMAGLVKTGWQQVEPAAGGFKVMMPGIPQESTKQQTTAIGPTVLHGFTYQADGGEFCVMYNDFSSDLDVEKTLTGVRDAEIGSGRLLTDVNVTVNGFRGKKISALVNGKVFASAIFVVGPRLYQVMYLGDAVPALLDAPFYLNSFQIIQK